MVEQNPPPGDRMAENPATLPPAARSPHNGDKYQIRRSRQSRLLLAA